MALWLWDLILIFHIFLILVILRSGLIAWWEKGTASVLNKLEGVQGGKESLSEFCTFDLMEIKLFSYVKETEHKIWIWLQKDYFFVCRKTTWFLNLNLKV